MRLMMVVVMAILMASHQANAQSVWKWSQTPASNANSDPTIDWTEGMSPATVNDSARSLMAAIASYRDDLSGTLTTGGTSTAYTLTTNQGLTALAAGVEVCFTTHTNSGANPTLAVDGTTAKSITGGSYILKSGTIYCVTYNGSTWALKGAGSAVAIALVGLSSALTTYASNDRRDAYGVGPGIDTTGSTFLFDANRTSAAADVNAGTLWVNKKANYTGTNSSVSPAFQVTVDIANGVDGNQAGVLAYLFNSNTLNSQPSGTASGVAMYGVGVCVVSGCSATWGGLAAVYGYDQTGGSPNSYLYGLEVDLYGTGADTNSRRTALLIAVGNTGVDSYMEGAFGILFSGGPGDGRLKNIISTANLSAINGINLNEVTWLSASSTAFASTGFAVRGDAGAAGTHGNVLLPVIEWQTFTVSNLPACGSTVPYGSMAVISDALTAPVYNTTIPSGGGIYQGLVMCQGGSWAWH